MPHQRNVFMVLQEGRIAECLINPVALLLFLQKGRAEPGPGLPSATSLLTVRLQPEDQRGKPNPAWKRSKEGRKRRRTGRRTHRAPGMCPGPPEGPHRCSRIPPLKVRLLTHMKGPLLADLGKHD
ncbi:unnamed protein product [Arctogadus glacialis]